MRWEWNRCLWHRTHFLIFFSLSLSFSLLIDEPIEIWFLISSSICLSFLSYHWNWRSVEKRIIFGMVVIVLFALCHHIYIYVWSQFYRCWIEVRHLIYIYQCRQTKKKNIYIYKREKDRENTFSFVLLPFLSDL
jgi:hypothetical protein